MANGSGNDGGVGAAGLGQGMAGDYGGPGYGYAGWGGYGYGYGGPGSAYGGPGYTGDIGGYGYDFGPVGMFGASNPYGFVDATPTAYPTEINTVPTINPKTQQIEYHAPQDIPARAIGVPMPAPNPLDPWDRGVSPVFDVRSSVLGPNMLENPPAFQDMPAAAFGPNFGVEAPGWIGMNPASTAPWSAGQFGDPSIGLGLGLGPGTTHTTEGQMGVPGPNSPASAVVDPQYWEPPPGADFATSFTNPTLENPYYHLFGGGTGGREGYLGPTFESLGNGQFQRVLPGYGGMGPGYGPMTVDPISGQSRPAYAERQTFAYSQPVWFDPMTGGTTYVDPGPTQAPMYWEMPGGGRQQLQQQAPQQYVQQGDPQQMLDEQARMLMNMAGGVR